MKNNILAHLISFTAICAETKKNEADYALPTNGTNEEMLIAYFRRTNLIAKAFNGAEKVRRADTRQKKWTIWAWVKPDVKATAGFALSFDVCRYDCALATLGARHACINEEVAHFMGNNCQGIYKYTRG